MSENPIAASYLYLLEPEIRFLEAAVEHLIPTDELGPGARDAGVVVYIDRQLAGSWGTHGRMYRGGPWLEGTPQQGYQSRFTPQEVYRIAIREIDQHCKAAFERNFAQLPGDRQLRLLQQLEKDEIALPSLSSKFFFDLLWRNTDEGYFADPLYGGNRDKVGWKLLGFPGLPSGRIPPPSHQQRAVLRRTRQRARRPDRPRAGRRGRLSEARDHQARQVKLRCRIRN